MKKEKVCVVGLGYVGLPLAVQAALRGYEVYGLDRDESKIKKINSGKSPIKEEFLHDNLSKVDIHATTDESIIKKCDIVLVCVPTPIDEKFFPDLGPVKGAVEMIIKNFKKGQLIVIESTINPGVCEEIIEPIFAQSGLKVGRDYEMAHCPERIDPGNKKWNVTNLPRVVGSFTKKGLNQAKKFYESIIDGEICAMNSIREAEATKIIENSFRDVNIAFVNELAKSFDKMGIDLVSVIKGASSKFSFMPHWPSCGVGGHCIPVDPYYLIERAKLSGFDHEFLKIARKINNSMPEYTVELLQDALNKVKLPLNGTTIGVLGLSYKANVDDLRETPALKIIDKIEEHGGKVLKFDPYFPEMSDAKTIETILKKSDAIVVVTNHKEFVEIKPEIFKKARIQVIVDGKNCLDKEAIEKLKIVYKGIGR
ncbi:MAG: nucleotide sugar dehydrogenase [Candidatus Moranbacteria bacterium]|nr:nucleotide sugar dehydrogenase [Candidatus Moranbacteria bacterium]